MKEWTVANELALQPVNLARVALLCAQEIEYPRLNIVRTMAQFGILAEQAKAYVPSSDPILYRGALLAEFLFSRLAFKGNRQDYGDPRNSFLNDVLQRHLGIPITLSILFMEVARRLDIPAFGIGMPGHFIVGMAGEADIWYLDPFNGGGRLSVSECARLVEAATGYNGPFQTHWLAPTDSGAITARLLNNLRTTYAQHKEWAKAIKAIELLRMVQPDVPEHNRDLGLIHFRRGATHEAARCLDFYLQQVPDAEDAQTIRDGLANTLDEWARLN